MRPQADKQDSKEQDDTVPEGSRHGREPGWVVTQASVAHGGEPARGTHRDRMDGEGEPAWAEHVKCHPQ